MTKQRRDATHAILASDSWTAYSIIPTRMIRLYEINEYTDKRGRKRCECVAAVTVTQHEFETYGNAPSINLYDDYFTEGDDGDAESGPDFFQVKHPINRKTRRIAHAQERAIWGGWEELEAKYNWYHDRSYERWHNKYALVG